MQEPTRGAPATAGLPQEGGGAAPSVPVSIPYTEPS